MPSTPNAVDNSSVKFDAGWTLQERRAVEAGIFAVVRGGAAGDHAVRLGCDGLPQFAGVGGCRAARCGAVSWLVERMVLGPGAARGDWGLRPTTVPRPTSDSEFIARDVVLQNMPCFRHWVSATACTSGSSYLWLSGTGAALFLHVGLRASKPAGLG